MLRLSGSQVLLTNRDVTRTLNPKRTRRPPTYLYTKGKQPLRSTSYAASAIPHINTPRHTISTGRRDRIPPLSAPVRPISPDWSTSSDTDSSDIDINMPSQSNLIRSTDGASDATAYFREMGLYRQVISLETIDSFPYVPYRTPPELMFQIYEDPMPSPVDEDLTFFGFEYHSSEWDAEDFAGGPNEPDGVGDADTNSGEDEGQENGGDNDEGDDNEDMDREVEEDQEEPIVLNEMIWDPDSMLIVEPRARMPDTSASMVATQLPRTQSQ